MFKLVVYSRFFTFISLIVFNQIISHEIKDKVRQLNNINYSLKKEQNKEILLKTDWVVRTSPERLQKLSEKYYQQLRLSPSKGENIEFINQEIEKVKKSGLSEKRRNIQIQNLKKQLPKDDDELSKEY